MLQQEKIIARFGKMSETSDEAKNVITVLMGEMETPELVATIKLIKADPQKDMPWFAFGLEIAETELARR